MTQTMPDIYEKASINIILQLEPNSIGYFGWQALYKGLVDNQTIPAKI
jgi:hypothetical protein